MPRMLKAVLRQHWFTGAATAVIAASAAYYLAFVEPDSIQSKEKKPKNRSKNKLSGLVNEGNTCFINATLQALASCPMFIWWIDTVLDQLSDITMITTASSLQLTMSGEFHLKFKAAIFFFFKSNYLLVM